MQIFTRNRIAIGSYALASIFYVPVVISGMTKTVEWLDIYGIYLLGPVFVSMSLYLFALSFLKTTHFQYVILNGSLMLGIIFGIPLLSWNRTDMQASISQTGPLIGIAGIFLFINFLLFLNLLMASRNRT